jgi:hypothetical protein
MNLYIRLVNGQPFEHPIFEDNFQAAFPDVDTNNLPANFARFERLQPAPAKYEVPESVVYVKQQDGVVRDVWAYREMTDAEKAEVAAAEKRQVYMEMLNNSGSVPNVQF